MPTDSPKSAIHSHVPLDPNADPIGIALRKVHEHIVSEPIPDEFLELLARLDDDQGKQA